MDKVRLGIIGLGWFGEIHGDAIAGIPEIELAALCTRTESRLDELAKKFGVTQTYTDYTEMLANPDIDAVSVVTMWDQHTVPVLDALQAGKHVFLEKPMASTVEDLRFEFFSVHVREWETPRRFRSPLLSSQFAD